MKREFRSKTLKEIKENAFSLDETGQNMHIFEEVLFFKLRTTIKIEKNTHKKNN